MDNRITLNFRKSHSRTKWGGLRDGIGKTRVEGEWYCQICGGKCIEGSPIYLFEIFPKEYIRICSQCYHFYKMGFDTVKEIKKLMKITEDEFYL